MLLRRGLGWMLATVIAVLPVLVLAEGVPVLEETPRPLLEQRGLPMTEAEARARIVFRPFRPDPNYTTVALLPPFHGFDKDDPANRGIGYAYVSRGNAFVLREWPRVGGSLASASYTSIPGVKGCSDAYVVQGTERSVRGIGWETATRIYALQMDGPAQPRALHDEWTRLVGRGACRG